MSTKQHFILAAAIGGLIAPAAAHCQDAGAPPTAAAGAPPTADAPAQPTGSSDDGEIIVSARKRQESILRVPVVENVITQATLERQQVVSLTDIAALTPGIVLGQAPLEVGTQVSIRGIGTTSLDPGIDQSVSLNLDGLQLSQGMAYSVGLFDMAQVEVLKGPQALFFGKNSPAGVVSIRTVDPGDKLEVIGRVSHEFVADQWRNEAIVSGPVTDTLGVRLSGLYGHTDGYFRNHAVAATQYGALQPAKDFGRANTIYLRGTVLWKPTSDLTARLKLNYTRDRDRDGAPFQLASCPDGTVSYLGTPFFAPGEDCRGDRIVNTVRLDPGAFPGVLNDGQPFTNTKQKFSTLELDYNVAPHLALTSVTGYYKLNTAALIGGTYNGQAASFVAAQKVFSRREVTQELRLNSDYAGPLNFTIGAFYENGRMKNDIDLLTNQALGFGTPAVLLTGTHDVRIESISGFGQLRYKLSPRFEIAGGVRYTDERRSDHAFTSFTGLAGPFVPVTPPRISSRNWSPELTLTWTPDDDLTVFGSLKQGYKSGSYNLIIPITPGQDNSFGDEKVQGGEIGLKTRLADRQIYLNAATYLYKYKGLQVGVNEATAGTGIPLLRTVNAGAAKVYGVDLDATYRPSAIQGLALNAAANWNHARFTSFRGAPCYGGQTISEGCNLLPTPIAATDPFPSISFSDPAVFNGAPSRYTSQDLKGLPLTRAPDWQVNLGGTYEMPVGRGMKLTFGANGQYTSKLLTNLGPREDFYQRAFAKLNANVALAGREDRWEVSLIANNLTDKYSTANCTKPQLRGREPAGGRVGRTDQGPGRLGRGALHVRSWT